MSNDFLEHLAAVDQNMLAPLVSEALRLPDIILTDWRYEVLEAAGGQYFGVIGMARFGGHVRDPSSGEMLTWSMILKAYAGDPDDEGQDVTHYGYWQRECLAYQSGLLAKLPSGLSAPRYFGTIEVAPYEYWIWMEDMGAEMDEPWPMEAFGRAARNLGRFNGAYLIGTPIPSFAWLSTGRVHNMLDLAAPVVETLEERLDHPVVWRWVGDGRLARVQQLWAQRNTLLSGLNVLPRSLCHHDAFCRNLLLRSGADGEEDLIAIDWAMIGTGAVGEEMAPLVCAALTFLDVDAADAWELDGIVFDGYLAGLSETGWRGDPHLVRFGYTATAALFSGIGLLGWLDFFCEDEGQVEAIFGHPPERVVDQLAASLDYELDLGDEALQLAEKLPDLL